jgi:Leucine rich repeat
VSALLFAFLIKSSSSASTKQVACEKVGLLYDYGPKTCFLQQATINAQGYFIASENDLTMKNLEFYFNREIRFLPVKVHKKFPNLMMINANYCSIKLIAKENFEKLNKLERLYLSGNHIEEIVTNTFEDLTSLEYLYLSK